MRREARVWMVVVTLCVLHFLLHVGFGFGPRAPDLLTVALLLASRELQPGVAAAAGLLLGLMEDAMSVLSFGANSLAMTLVGALGALTRDLFVGDSFVFLISYFLLGKWIRDLAHWSMVSDAVRQPFVDGMLVQAPLASLYAASVAVVVVLLTGLWREGPSR